MPLPSASHVGMLPSASRALAVDTLERARSTPVVDGNVSGQVGVTKSMPELRGDNGRYTHGDSR